MLKKILALFTMLMYVSTAFSQPWEGEESGCCSEEPRLHDRFLACLANCGLDLAGTLDIGGGYRQDSLKWAYPGFSPGVAIHKKWEEINIGMIEANSRLLVCNHILLKIDFDYGWFGDQKINHVKVIDYNSAEVVERHFKARGSVYDISGGIGYQFSWCCDTLFFTPLVGWSYYHQTFKAPPFYAEHHSGFKTPHKTSRLYWNGPWVGFETAYRWNCDWQFYVSYEFHGAYYHANFKDFFRDQAKNMKALGNEFEVGGTYQFCNCWWAGLKFNYKNFWTNKRHTAVETFNSEGHSKRVQWFSYFVTLDLGLQF